MRRGGFAPKQYAYYKGDELIMIGTTQEIANYLGVKQGTVQKYVTPSHRKKQINTPYERKDFLIRLEE